MNVETNNSVQDISDINISVGGAVRPVNEVYISVSGAIKKVWPNKKALNDCTWYEISEISSSGQAANYFAVGDCKEVTLNGTIKDLTLTNFTCCVFIIGINHNSKVEGNNLIHFQFAKTALENGTDICFVDSMYNTTGTTAAFRMNASNTNSGGWESSYMRNSVIIPRKDMLLTKCFMYVVKYSETDLFSVLKSVMKYTDNTGGGAGSVLSNVTATTDYIFLLAEYEVFGKITFSNSYETNYQQQYSYYVLGNSKLKYMYNFTGQIASWWLRSPGRGYSTSFQLLNTAGVAGSIDASCSIGFSPCFCV